MTTSITIPARKRNFTILAEMPELSTTAETVTTTKNWVDSSSNQMVDNLGNHLVFNAGSPVYPRIVRAVKRNFTIVGAVKNG